MLVLLQSSMPATKYLILALPLVGSMLLVYGIYQVIVETRQGERKRLVDRIQGDAKRKKLRQHESILRRTAQSSDDHGLLTSIVGRLSIIPKLQVMFDQANVDWSATQALTNLLCGGVGTFLALRVLSVGFLVSVACGAGVVLVPLGYLSIKRKRRMKRLVGQLPDVFDMMSQALRAGHSLASGIQLVQTQMPDPIGTEFGRVYQEQNLGIKIEDALLSMADRINQLDVRFFVTAVLIQRQTGGDLAEVLDKIGKVIRERIQLFALVQGLTAEGRLSGWVLFSLPIIVFLATLKLNPSYAGTLLHERTGQILLCIAIGLQIMGMAMIRWIVNIKM